MECCTPTVYLNPVFIEPNIKHSLLNSYKYTFIILFEICIISVLLFTFFKTEILMLLRPKKYKSENYINKLKSATLICDGNVLKITGLANAKILPALALNKEPISINECKELLYSINGSRQVSLNDVLRKRQIIF
ncbi:IMV protein, entry/fusion [Eptesipox virus]|uniref:IMV protein, entry/fusion n=1 Tax=Eptesipox virus TaxID=1329402 RepID=A0A220T6D2_9POXV|nr:IMV protein, entry/fusion [Eptesipox virus]ASK51269.1 IMV protein, entry/fusion [Eptesipox virus]WAH71027.1 IMV protein, entry/fusion [Eptesipox virus]